ncbi:YczE/YyaS/YitT family protein [Bacillus marinisedimentorum]|uniref:YczE/YyaS/YitT family protein n=1 Tax=Bacillus marinisedimentorum TaxID=1821260 RepID=UPI0007E282E6|nr:hypothetical protein [Bacillus marinisedimentorum]
MGNTKVVRFSFYGIGLLILTLGIASTIVAGVGTSPFDALLVGMSQMVGLTPGSWEFLVGLGLIGINAIVMKKRLNLLALMTAFLTGAGIDFWLLVYGHTWQPEEMMGQWFVFLAGVVIVGFGISTYLQSRFAPMPLDESMLMLREMFNMKMWMAKMVLSLMFLILAWLVDGPIWLGTIVVVFLSGPVIGFFYPIMEKFSGKFETGIEPKPDLKQRESV